MLKIKFNINEFTIIFLRRFEGKNERKKNLFQCLFCVSPPFYFRTLFFCSLFSPLSFFSSVSALFLVSVQRHFFCFCSALLFLLSASFLLPLVPPFCCLLVALRFFLFFLTCCPIFSAQNTFSAQILFQPKNSLFVVQRLLLFFFSSLLFFLSASFSFSCQLPRPKIFSLAASHLFYLSKSLFSSNME